MLQTTAESGDCENLATRAAAAPCRSVLMVGTDLAGKGGIRAVVQGYIDGGLFDRVNGIYIATHRYGSTWAKFTAALRGWTAVAMQLRKLDAPLVHVQTASRASFWRKSVVCLMARAAGRPYLLHLHGGEFVQFYESESGALRRRYIRNILRNAQLVLALSEQWRERLLRICPAAQVEVLTNAVALPELDRRPARRDGAACVLFLGDVNRGKGSFDLLRAFAAIAPRFPGLRLLCAGTGSLQEIRRLATQLHVADRVECPGWIGPERKRAELAAATLFALPSYAEGMPMALLEAMSWSLPVVATCVGGIPQLITNERNGLLIAPGDVEALAAAIERLMNDPSLRQRLGTAARATVATSFTLDATLTQLTQIYSRFGIEARAWGRMP